MGCDCADLDKPIPMCKDAKLQSIPKSLGKCSNLQVLDLGFSDLRSFPSWLGQLSKLQYLGMEAATQGFHGHEPPAAKFPSQSNLPELMLAYLRNNNFRNV